MNGIFSRTAPIRALVVDDEEDMRVVATVFLEMDGQFEVTAVSGGQDALTAAVAHTPDVILLDYMMPGMNGPETLAALLGNPKTSCVPVIFLTAKADAGQLKASGARGVIQKPFNPDTLSADILNILQGSK